MRAPFFLYHQIEDQIRLFSFPSARNSYIPFLVSFIMEKPDYGNWVPQKVLLFFLFASIVSYLITFLLNIRLVVGILKIASLLFLGIFIYLQYVYWLLEKDD